MKLKKLTKALFLSTLLVSTFIQPGETRAGGIPVFDGANMAQNILTAIRTLTSNINEAKMILNQIKDLTKIEITIGEEFNEDLQNLFSEVGQIQGLMEDITNLQIKFEELYPDFSLQFGSPTQQQFSDLMKASLDESRKSMLGAAKTGAQVLENVKSSQRQLDRLMTASQGAVGNLQVQQLGNEINSVVASNLINLNTQTATLSQALMTFLNSSNTQASANQQRMKDVLRGQELMVAGSGAPRAPF